jgi:chromosome segregation ATPase
MAQVEVIMYVALGFAAAALIALLLGRLLWSLAVGVGRRRAQRSSPTPAVAELQAERNQLRAEHAMMARRVEVRLDDLKAQVAEHMAEVSRSRNRIDRLGAEIDKRDAMLAERDSEIARLKEQVAALVAEFEAQTETLHHLQGEHGREVEANAILREKLAERDREIERLRGEVDQLGQARSDAVSRERTVQERLKERIEDLSSLSRQIEAQRRELAVQQSQSQALRESLAEPREPETGADAGEETPVEPVEPVEHRIEDAERQAGELQSELDRLDEMWAAKLADVAQAVASDAAAPPAGDEPQAPEPVPADMEKPAAVNGDAGQAVAAQAAERPDAAPAEDDKKSAPGLANVISLAQRIRALQRNES